MGMMMPFRTARVRDRLVGASLNFCDTSRPTDGRIGVTRATEARYVDSTGTVQTVPANVLRANQYADHDPTTGECLGALFEEARTNSVLYSNRPAVQRRLVITGAVGSYTVGETVTCTSTGTGTVLSSTSTEVLIGAFSGTFSGTLTGSTSGATSSVFNSTGIWTHAASGTATAPVLTENAGLAPDGTMTATRAIFALNGGTTTNDRSDLNPSVAANTAGQPQSGAYWLRSYDGVSSYNFRLDFNGSTADANGTTSDITVTGEWQRFEVNVASAIDAARRCILRLRGTLGTSDSADILIWNAQQELDKPSVTSDIVTTSTAGTRNADVPTVDGVNFENIWNQVQGTIITHQVRGSSNNVDGSFLQADDGTNNNRYSLGSGGSGSVLNPFVVTGGVGQATLTQATGTARGEQKLAFGYKANDFVASTSGAANVTDSSGSPPTVDRLHLGKIVSGSYWNGHIKRLTIARKKFTNSRYPTLSAM